MKGFQHPPTGDMKGLVILFAGTIEDRLEMHVKNTGEEMQFASFFGVPAGLQFSAFSLEPGQHETCKLPVGSWRVVRMNGPLHNDESLALFAVRERRIEDNRISGSVLVSVEE